MDIKENDLKEIFTNLGKCDFCGNSEIIIARATLHPIFYWKEGIEMIDAVALAKKCIDCCKEGK
jgi:hypothetical protein